MEELNEAHFARLYSRTPWSSAFLSRCGGRPKRTPAAQVGKIVVDSDPAPPSATGWACCLTHPPTPRGRSCDGAGSRSIGSKTRRFPSGPRRTPARASTPIRKSKSTGYRDQRKAPRLHADSSALPPRLILHFPFSRNSVPCVQEARTRPRPVQTYVGDAAALRLAAVFVPLAAVRPPGAL